MEARSTLKEPSGSPYDPNPLSEYWVPFRAGSGVSHIASRPDPFSGLRRHPINGPVETMTSVIFDMSLNLTPSFLLTVVSQIFSF
jgi:hypothetical protein